MHAEVYLSLDVTFLCRAPVPIRRCLQFTGGTHGIAYDDLSLDIPVFSVRHNALNLFGSHISVLCSPIKSLGDTPQKTSFPQLN